MINGQAHGPQRGTATCQLHLRRFSDGDTIVVEPFRSAGFPIVKDLVVDRGAFDRIIEAGGYITAPTGCAPDANLIAVPKEDADRAMDAAACIGCGACVAACPNGAGQLFTAAKLAHLNLLPQGQPERRKRTLAMVEAMEQLLRLLHEPPRVRGRVPEGDQHRLHRDAQPRLPQGRAGRERRPDRPPAGRGARRRIEERHRRRVIGYAATARRIDARITALRVELERALRAVDDAVARRRRRGGRRRGARARARAGLARARPAARRLLAARLASASVVDDPGLEPFGEGPA